MLKTLLIIFEQFCLYFPFALGSYISFSALKVPDISIEAAYIFGAILATKISSILNVQDVFLSSIIFLFFGVLGGAFVGFVSAVFTKLFNLPHLISSIITIGIFHGINQFVLGSAIFSIGSSKNYLNVFNLFIQSPEFILIFFAFLILLILGFLFFKTKLGVVFFVYGNNPLFFQYHNVSSKFVFMVGLLISNALAGLSGCFIAQSNGFADINSGFGFALFGVTSVILGNVMLFAYKKTITILVPVFGTFLYFIIQQLLLKVGFDLKYFTMVQSLIVFLLLAIKYSKNSGQISNDNLGV